MFGKNPFRYTRPNAVIFFNTLYSAVKFRNKRQFINLLARSLFSSYTETWSGECMARQRKPGRVGILFRARSADTSMIIIWFTDIIYLKWLIFKQIHNDSLLSRGTTTTRILACKYRNISENYTYNIIMIIKMDFWHLDMIMNKF